MHLRIIRGLGFLSVIGIVLGLGGAMPIQAQDTTPVEQLEQADSELQETRLEPPPLNQPTREEELLELSSEDSERIQSPEILQQAAPTCTRWSTSHIDCFVVGHDYNIWHIAWNADSQWASWSKVGYPARRIDPAGGLSVVSRGVNSLDLFAIGYDGAYYNLYRRTWNGSNWGVWSNLSGPGTTNVYETACTSTSSTTIDCFIRGNDNKLWQRSWNGTTWGFWTDLGIFPSQSALGGLAATHYGSGSIVVYAIGSDGNAYRRFREQGNWFNWINDSHPLSYPLKQVSCGSQSSTIIDCAFTDNDGGVWYREWTSSTGWSAFLDLGYPASFSTGIAISHYGTDYQGIVVMSNASDGRFYRKFRNVGTDENWLGWFDHGRPTDLRIFVPYLHK